MRAFLGILLVVALAAGRLSAQAPAPTLPKTPGAVSNFVAVTDQTIRAPKPEDWLIHRGNYQAWGYSPLDQVNKANVKNLQLVWSRNMEPGANEATPLVYNGVMYLGNPGDVIQAIDAATGDLMWEYRHPLPAAGSLRNGLGQRKRSIALYGDNIYFVTWDNKVVALGARSGEMVWQTDRGGDLDVSNSSGPIVANGVVVAGSTCQYSSHGCYVTGHDARTGRELWRNEMIPRPGEPGDETWAGSPFEKRWMTGVWGQLTYDPELDLVYYGSSGVGAADMLSVNPDARRGPRKTLTGVPCKTGIVWSFDAANGEFLWAKPTTEQNMVARIDPKGLVTVNENAVLKEVGKTYHVCPTYNGGRDWPQVAYNPKVNVMYVPLSNLCIDSTSRTDRGPAPQFVYNTTNVGKFATGKDKVGRIDAISVETGKT